MKKICVVTSSRADYGILRPLIARLCKEPNVVLQIVATGMHLCHEYGNTFNEILDDGFEIHRKIEIQLSSDEPVAMSKSMGMAMICFADYFKQYTPDILILLGDRYEIMAVACAAVNQRIPIAHIHGGETTEGAVDEFFRHSITKMSLLHFTSCEVYRRRVIQLGEEPNRVFNVGSLSVENIMKAPLMSTDELSESLGFRLESRKYCVVTFHPVTLEDYAFEKQLSELMFAMDKFPEMRYIITKANSDAGGRVINSMWEDYVSSRKNCLLVASLGMTRYLSALKHCVAMVGNSSSGILEGPALKIPTVNIGDRQKGRLAASSIIHCEPTQDSIFKAIKKALGVDFRALCANLENPYGNGKASENIIAIIQSKTTPVSELKKKFYDINTKELP